METFYEILTSGPVQPTKGKGASKGSKQAAFRKISERTAEIPWAETPENPFSQRTEAKEIDRLIAAKKNVDTLFQEEKAKLAEREKLLNELRESEGAPLKSR